MKSWMVIGGMAVLQPSSLKTHHRNDTAQLWPGTATRCNRPFDHTHPQILIKFEQASIPLFPQIMYSVVKEWHSSSSPTPQVLAAPDASVQSD